MSTSLNRFCQYLYPPVLSFEPRERPLFLLYFIPYFFFTTSLHVVLSAGLSLYAHFYLANAYEIVLSEVVHEY